MTPAVDALPMVNEVGGDRHHSCTGGQGGTGGHGTGGDADRADVGSHDVGGDHQAIGAELRQAGREIVGIEHVGQSGSADCERGSVAVSGVRCDKRAVHDAPQRGDVERTDHVVAAGLGLLEQDSIFDTRAHADPSGAGADIHGDEPPLAIDNAARVQRATRRLLGADKAQRDPLR